ncbi:unnamed protein product [Caenorhabditis sp. 36 PRJEB53466]|nr:unnamed protein product [Caenorhabditis sp. 36 PRJEB53466]
MQSPECGEGVAAPTIPPRTHPIHLRNRLKLQLFEANLTASTEVQNDECHSRKASSVGFVDIDDLLKFQEEYKTRSSSRLDVINS